MIEDKPFDPLAFLANGGEMGRRIGEYDWSKTTLGSVASWSPALRTVVRLMLSNRLPMLLWWGPQYISIYNDPYIPVLGNKHPWGLGRQVSECWKEIWDVLKPLIDTPFYGGPATWNEDILLVINRYGFNEETHWLIAYSPVPDESVPSGIGGVLATVHEATAKILSERRMTALRDLSSHPSDAKTAEAACVASAATLASHAKDIPFALLYLTEADGRNARLAARAGVDEDVEIGPQLIDLETSNAVWPLDEVRKTMQPQVVADLGKLFASVPHGPWPDPPTTAVVLPISSGKSNEPIGYLVAGVSSALRLDDTYRGFLDLVAAQFGTTIGNARAYDEEKRGEALLRESEDRLYTLIERCPFGIYIVDADFRILTVNARSQEGAFANVRPVIGRPFDEAMRIIWPEDVATEIVEHFRHTLDTGEPYYSKDFVNPRADTEMTEGYEWELHRISLSNGRYGVVCYYYDATKLRLAEWELKQADRKKDEFLAMLSHELRNPLAPLRNGLQVMKMAPQDFGAVEQSRTVMERQLGHMVRLIDDLMDISRISRGKIQLRKERVPLAKVIQQAVETSRPLIDAGGHRFTQSVPSDPIYVDVDVTRMAQVFSNLMNNAAKYTERGGAVSLSVERRGSDVAVIVRDSGVGIPAQMLPKVFDMFTQVDRNIEKAQGGLGIGLWLVRKLVEMHGGVVEARSQGHGEGSEFAVRLPVVLALAGEMLEEKPDLKKVASVRRRILVVDDNRDSANSLSLLLRIMGNDIQTTYDGLSALELGAEFQPHVILLDIGMPKVDGYETARRIRQTAWGKSAVLIAQTGWGQEDDKRKSQSAGFNFHVVKPIDPATLEKLLSELRIETA